MLSPIGFSILSGAGLIKGTDKDTQYINVHATTVALVDNDGIINLGDALSADEQICPNAPLFVLGTEADGSATGDVYQVDYNVEEAQLKVKDDSIVGKTVVVDYYVSRKASTVSEIQIDAENFAGYYYVEADTLFRRQDNGVDMPAIITLPNVKIQSNFTFSMASSGDPSTFDFTMDAFPGYTYFDQTKKVLCVIQIVEDADAAVTNWETVMPHGGAQ